MRQSLHCHPATPCTAIAEIDVELSRGAGRELTLTYRARGTITSLRLLPPAAPIHTDNLWQHTCFEAFVRAPGAGAYQEFNFSPSTAWAAYSFTAYREGMANGAPVVLPLIETRAMPAEFELRAHITVPLSPPWRLSLTAVIEETNGSKSYWALAHPAGKPDFHHIDGFILELD